MSNTLLERRPLAVPMPGPCPVIASPRLVLRPHRLSDADGIARSLSDFSISRMLARVPQPYDRQDAVDWLQTRLSETCSEWSLAITSGDDLPIGVVSIELRGQSWHLGYWLNREYWGKGIMTEAAGAVLDRFLRHMPETEVLSGAFADNLASLKVQQKLGFRIIDCSETFNLARNAMIPHIDTRLSPPDLQRP